jgi:hypothetical protein
MNFGTITTNGFSDPHVTDNFAGVDWSGHGTLINGSAADMTALIAGGKGGGINSTGGIYIENFGTITAAGDGGVILKGVASSIVNGTSLDTGAVIDGGGYGYGVLLEQATLANFGTIIGGSHNGTADCGIAMQTGGYALNAGTIIGFIGAEIDGQSRQTLVNKGLIHGTGGTAVKFENSAASVLVVDPGASFEGIVQANTYHTDVLALGAGRAAEILAGIGSSFTNFATIALAADWTVEGDIAGLTSHMTIDDFDSTDTIIVDGFDAVSDTYRSGIGLELIDAAAATITLDMVGAFSTGDFHVVGSATDTTISMSPDAPCFAAGTWILTPSGQVLVEQLQIGDLVISRDGEDVPITWIGRRRIDLLRHPHPAQAQPVCIVADALDEGIPCRNLVVSPDHALFLGGHLIPAKALVNGASIYQLNRASVVYYHIELAAHGIIFAEHAAVESYLETGNRGAFENGGGATILHPDFGQALREAGSCAPFIESGPAFEEVRFRLSRRLKAVSSMNLRDIGRRQMAGCSGAGV